jgi:Peptidase family M48
MHFALLALVTSLALLLRCTWSNAAALSWQRQWQQALIFFLLPGLLFLTSAVSIVWMGPNCQMLWQLEDWLSYWLAVIFLMTASWQGVWLVRRGHALLAEVRTYPLQECQGYRVRILDLSTPYIAQVGFWQAELVVTTGLLKVLSTEQLTAALAHEQAHLQHRDTFYFFCWGWLKRITTWLPQTEGIWQELLTLREIRADRWASQQTDPLTVAEALLAVIQSTPFSTLALEVSFNQADPVQRFNQRIEALLTNTADETSSSFPWSWMWLLMGFFPLLILPFHHS